MSILQNYLNNYNSTVAPAMREMAERTRQEQAMQDRIDSRTGFNSSLGGLRERIGDGSVQPQDLSNLMARQQDYAASNPNDADFVNSYNQMLALGQNTINQRNDLEAERIKAGTKAQKAAQTAKQAQVNRQQKLDLDREDKFLKFTTTLAEKYDKSDPVAAWTDTRNSYKSIKELASIAAEGNNSTADSALVVAFNKSLDPGSVVREGEYDRATEYANVYNSMKTKLNKMLGTSKILTPAVRQEMVRVSRKLAAMRAEAAAQKSKKVKKQYDRAVKTYGRSGTVDEKNYSSIIGDLDPEIEYGKYREEMRSEAEDDYMKYGKPAVDSFIEQATAVAKQRGISAEKLNKSIEAYRKAKRKAFLGEFYE